MSGHILDRYHARCSAKDGKLNVAVSRTAMWETARIGRANLSAQTFALTFAI